MTEWFVIVCEDCGEDCYEGAVEHVRVWGHLPVVGGQPVAAGTWEHLPNLSPLPKRRRRTRDR